MSRHDLLKQAMRVDRIQRAYMAYAREIGCEYVAGDEIVCNDDQWRLLTKKWNELVETEQ